MFGEVVKEQGALIEGFVMGVGLDWTELDGAEMDCKK